MTALLALGLDATDIGRIERLLAEGRMPRLAELRAGALHGLLESRPDAFVNMVWPTLVSGLQAGDHGWHSAKMWRPERMRLEYGDPARLPLSPFWSALEEAGARLALLDVPFAPPPSPAFQGIALSGWQTHDEALAASRPADLRRRLRRRHGRPALGPEIFGPQTPASLERLHRQALHATRQFADIVRELLADGPFDLFLAVFGAAHRAGHYLWDLSQIDARGLTAERRRALEGALDEIYVALDAAIGRVLDAAGGRFDRILLFAAHGMGPSDGWLHMLDAMLARIQGAPPSGANGRGLLYRLKKRLPWNLVREVTIRLPASANRALVPLWSRRMHDWSRTRVFTVPFDVHGFLRVNLRGRERDGIVEPGAAYEDLCGELREALEGFIDIAGGRPVSAGVVRSRDLFPEGRRTGLLPDLVVRIGEPLRGSPGLVSPRFGELRFPAPGRFPSGRSGNHHPRGWYLLAGAGTGGRRDGVVVDFAPTVLAILGVVPPPRMRGRPLHLQESGHPAGGRRIRWREP